MKFLVLMLCLTGMTQLYAQMNELLTLSSLPSGSDVIESNSVVMFEDLKLEPTKSYDVLLWNGSEGYSTQLVTLQPNVRQFTWSVGSLQGKYFRLSIVESRSRKTVMSSPAYFEIIARENTNNNIVEIMPPVTISKTVNEFLNDFSRIQDANEISMFDICGRLLVCTKSVTGFISTLRSANLSGMFYIRILLKADGVQREELRTVLMYQ